MNGLTCWKCGADLKAVSLPLGRRAECPACHAELHVCRMCRHFLPGKARPCMEPMAEPVKDSTRANFCDWFQPGRSRWVAAMACLMNSQFTLLTCPHFIWINTK